MNDLEDTLSKEETEKLEKAIDELPDWLLGKGDEDFSEEDAEKWTSEMEEILFPDFFPTPEVVCEKCDKLAELYERTPQEPRDYWLTTEIFVMLHDGDVCKKGYNDNQND